MLYLAYQLQSDIMTPVRTWAGMAAGSGGAPLLSDHPALRNLTAVYELIARAGLTHTRPPFAIDSVPKIVRGDYINVSGALDLTLSTVDNAIFTGTGFSGALRALEQSWGRDPSTMIPDVRFTPNPADAPVERGE